MEFWRADGYSGDANDAAEARMDHVTQNWRVEKPVAASMLKAGLNAADDGLAGIQQLAGDATLL